MSEMNILLVDDHPLFCDALSMTLSEIFDDPKILKASKLSDAIEITSNRETIHLIVLDYNLPDVSGNEGLEQLLHASKLSKIVVVSSVSDNGVIASILDMGASGFIAKGAGHEEMAMAFHKVMDGEIYAPKDFHKPKKAPLNQEQIKILERIETLTPQQANILKLLCEGKFNKEMAQELSIVETTVKAHLTAILRKLGVQTRTQAVLLAKKVDYTSRLKSPN